LTPTSMLFNACVNSNTEARSLKNNSMAGTPSAWPVDGDLNIRWFEYRFHSVIIDLCDDPVIHDEL